MAARKLHVASSAVNRQILKIEDELGVKLFERHANGIRLTHEGELLQEHVKRTLMDAEKTLSEIKVLHKKDRETITIVGQESVIARFLPPALVALHGQYPKMATSFKAADGNELKELLLSGVADIALAFDPQPHPDIEIRASCELEVGAIMTQGHPLQDRRSISLKECVSYPVILPDQSWPLRALLDREIQALGVQLDIVTSSNSEEFLRSMLDQKLGIGFQTVMGIEAQLETRELVLVPLINDEPIRQRFSVCVLKSSSLPKPLQYIIDSLGERLQQYTID